MNGEHHINCQSLLNSLSDYVDGNLGSELCADIERHISECHDCRIVVDTMKRTIYLYHKTAGKKIDIPDVVRERLYRSLNLDDYLK